MKIESEMSKNNNLGLKWNKIWFKVKFYLVYKTTVNK